MISWLELIWKTYFLHHRNVKKTRKFLFTSNQKKNLKQTSTFSINGLTNAAMAPSFLPNAELVYRKKPKMNEYYNFLRMLLTFIMWHLPFSFWLWSKVGPSRPISPRDFPFVRFHVNISSFMDPLSSQPQRPFWKLPMVKFN